METVGAPTVAVTDPDEIVVAMGCAGMVPRACGFPALRFNKSGGSAKARVAGR